jgi:NADH:ubiquinone oxidoreductase subunit 6 (subunit J)
MTAFMIVLAAFCALRALHASRLLLAATWLAGVSASTAVVLFLLGSQEIAIIELNIGAGLVTVLFVFAISMAGDESIRARPLVPRMLAAGLGVLLIVVLVTTLFMLSAPTTVEAAEGTLGTALWHQRSADLMLHVAIIYAGLLGVMGLISQAPEAKATEPHPLETAGEVTDGMSKEYGT